MESPDASLPTKFSGRSTGHPSLSLGLESRLGCKHWVASLLACKHTPICCLLPPFAAWVLAAAGSCTVHSPKCAQHLPPTPPMLFTFSDLLDVFTLFFLPRWLPHSNGPAAPCYRRKRRSWESLALLLLVAVFRAPACFQFSCAFVIAGGGVLGPMQFPFLCACVYANCPIVDEPSLSLQGSTWFVHTCVVPQAHFGGWCFCCSYETEGTVVPSVGRRGSNGGYSTCANK